MYYQNFSYPVRYELFFATKDNFYIWIDRQRGKIKVKKHNLKTRYIDKDDLPALLHGVERKSILEKINTI